MYWRVQSRDWASHCATGLPIEECSEQFRPATELFSGRKNELHSSKIGRSDKFPGISLLKCSTSNEYEIQNIYRRVPFARLDFVI